MNLKKMEELYRVMINEVVDLKYVSYKNFVYRLDLCNFYKNNVNLI